jgi:putative ABC transport system permease protein
MNLLRLSWKNLTFKPLSTLLSIVLFALGVGLVALLFLLQKQVEDNFEKNLAGIDLVIGAKGSPLQLILSSMYHLDAPTGNISIAEIKPFLNPKHPLIETSIPLSLGDSYRTFRIVGTTPSILDFYGVSLASGKAWAQNFEVVIGNTVAQKLGLTLGSTFSSSHGFLEDDNLGHEHTAFKVVGILAGSGTVLDQLILTTNQSYWLTHEHDAASEEAAPEEDNADHADHDHEDHADHDHDHASPSVTVPSLLEEPGEKEITALLVKFKGRNFQALNMQRSINENTDLQAATPAIEINRLYSLMDTGEKALRILAFVIIFVSGLSIFISLFASLKERQYELALLRVMGGTRVTLFTLIILEGLLLALLGCVFGLLLSHGGMQLFAGALEKAYGYTFSGWTFLPQEWYLVGGSLLLGLVAAVLPAIKASRTDISETLLKG